MSTKDIYMLANEAYSSENWLLAYDLFEKVSEDKKFRKQSLLKLAKISETLNNRTKAVSFYEKLILSYGETQGWLFWLGENHRHLKNWKLAIDNYHKVLLYAPEHLRTFYGLSKSYCSINEYSKAVVYIDKAIQQKEKSFYWAFKGIILARQHCFEDAINCYKKAVDVEEKEIKVDWLIKIADLNVKVSNYNEAIDFYNKAVIIKPQHAILHAALGHAYARKSDHENAIFQYNTAVQLDATNSKWFVELGRLLSVSDKEGAIAAFKKAIELGRSYLSYEIALLSNNLGELSYVSSKALVGFSRFDLCVKILYIRTVILCEPINSNLDYSDIYKKHIYLRTKGKEPGNENKNSVDKYVESFGKLVGDILEYGYDSKYPIPLAKNRSLINGAHRSAAVIALNLEKVPVVFLEDEKGIDWSFNWFYERGFNNSELNELLLCWLQYSEFNGHIIILWPPVMDYWDEIEATISDSVEIITKRDLKFSDLGFSELIKDIYSMDSVAEFMPNIMLKSERLAAFAPKIRLLVVYGDTEKVNSLKSSVRKAYNSIIPEKLFCTLHASSDHQETMHLARIFFHQPTLELLQNRSHSMSKHLAAWVKEAKDELIKRNVEVTEGCAVGGAVLDAFGIRNADDLDITVSNSVRASEFTKKAMPLSINVDLVNENYARSASGIISDEVLINDRAHHVYIRGFKFANLDIVRNRKAYSQRDKDMMDLKNITKFYWG